MTETRGTQPDHWLALESPGSGGSCGCRIESVGVKLPSERLTTRNLMDRTSHRTHIQLERLENGYSTGTIAAVQAAMTSGRLGEARNTLMLAAGAGITVALALYRQVPP